MSGRRGKKKADGPAFRVDESQTAAGHQWWCNACRFSTPSKDRAVDHAIASKTSSPFPHLLYERSRASEDGRVQRDARRRVAVYASGLVQVEAAA